MVLVYTNSSELLVPDGNTKFLVIPLLMDGTFLIETLHASGMGLHVPYGTTVSNLLVPDGTLLLSILHSLKELNC